MRLLRAQAAPYLRAETTDNQASGSEESTRNHASGHSVVGIRHNKSMMFEFDGVDQNSARNSEARLL